MKTAMKGSGPTLIDERPREVKDVAQLTEAEAEEWQRAQAWATWEKLIERRGRTVSRAEVMRVFSKERRPRAP